MVPDDRLQAEAFALAKSLAEGPRMALRYMKDNLDEALLFDFETARDHEAERLVRLTTTADHKEAVQAFIDKRKAVFTEAEAPKENARFWCGQAGLSSSSRD